MLELNGKTTTPAGDKPKFSLLRYDDVTRALRDAEIFSNDVYFDLLDYLTMETTPGCRVRSRSASARTSVRGCTSRDTR